MGVDGGGFTEQDAGVFLVAEDGAQRGADIAGRKGAGGHLVKEGLKEVKIAAVEQGDLHGGVTQRAGGVEPSESAAKDQDAVCDMSRIAEAEAARGAIRHRLGREGARWRPREANYDAPLSNGPRGPAESRPQAKGLPHCGTQAN